MTATWGESGAVGWAEPFIAWDGQPVAVFGEQDVLSGGRLSEYRFDVLSSAENLLGSLTSVEAGGALSWDAYASVKGGGELTVSDLDGSTIDWLNVRIRPHVILRRPGGGDDVDGVETPLGVFLCSAPVEQWDVEGRSWKVELLDKLSILDQDVASGSLTGITSYSAPAGANVVDTVKALITETGESVAAVVPGAATLATPMVWDVGTTRLKIINDLLDAGGFFSLWCDGWGQYQATPYVPPSVRVPVYESLLPFSAGATSLMTPQWERDRDVYSIPNRYIVIGQGDGDTEALTSTATNTDPTSPYSFAARGRWITAVETGVEATSQAELDSIAARRLSAATSVTTTINVAHAYLPDLLVNAVVRFVNPDAGLDIRCSVNTLQVPLDPLALCSSTLRVVA